MPVDGILVSSGNLQKPYELEIRVSLIDISAKFEITTLWGLCNNTILQRIMRTIFFIEMLIFMCNDAMVVLF